MVTRGMQLIFCFIFRCSRKKIVLLGKNLFFFFQTYQPSLNNFFSLIEKNMFVAPDLCLDSFWVAFVIQALHQPYELSLNVPFCPKKSRPKMCSCTINRNKYSSERKLFSLSRFKTSKKVGVSFTASSIVRFSLEKKGFSNHLNERLRYIFFEIHNFFLSN